MIINSIINKVQENGIYNHKNFLKQDEVNYLINLLKNQMFEKGNKKTYFPINSKEFLLKIAKFQFGLIYKSIKLKQLAIIKSMPEISGKIFNGETSLNMIDCYKTLKGNENILPWHIDLSYSGKKGIAQNKIANPYLNKIKFFIYLTEVGPENGCTSYIPGSHKITMALREGLYFKILKYVPHWHLKDLRSFVVNNIEYFYKYFKSKIETDNFLQQTAFIKSGENDNKYDFSMSPGDAIIFDEGGVHKGSKCLRNDRMVLRFHYVLNDNYAKKKILNFQKNNKI